MTYGRGANAYTALRNLSLSVRPGEYLCLMGSSGSGKTTVLNLAAGLCQPTSGRVHLLGHDLTGLRDRALVRLRRKLVGFVFQTLNLVPTMTIWQNVELPLVVNHETLSRRTQRVRQLLELAGLQDRAEAYPDALSNGQRQQIAVLRAVAHQPAIVLMDEPTSSLDSARASILLDLITELNRSEGVTIILTTHDALVAERAGGMLHLRDGTLLDGACGVPTK